MQKARSGAPSASHGCPRRRLLLSKQAFANYYFMASSALLVAAIGWPDPGTDEPTAA